jgi:hypothetical protein
MASVSWRVMGGGRRNGCGTSWRGAGVGSSRGRSLGSLGGSGAVDAVVLGEVLVLGHWIIGSRGGHAGRSTCTAAGGVGAGLGGSAAGEAPGGSRTEREAEERERARGEGAG